MSVLNDDHKISFKCPNCKTAISVSVKQVKKEEKIDCTCGQGITLEDTSLSEGINSANKAIDDFKKNLKKRF